MRVRTLGVAGALAMLACGGGAGGGDADAGGGDRVSIMTWNTAHGELSSMEAVAEVIRRVDPEVVLLQETHAEQAEALGDRLGMAAPGGSVSKSALFAANDARLTTSVELTSGRWSRSIDLYSYRGVTIANTHLSTTDDPRRIQAGEVLEVLGGADPAILAGDLNAGPDSETLRTFEDAGWHNLSGDAPTFPSRGVTLDYILATRDWAPVSVRVVHSDASDHYPVVVDLAASDLPE